MPELKGSRTEQNLMAAFAGESQAHTKYQYYASQAKKDGFEQIAAIFTETSLNEKEHAKLWFKALNSDSVPPTINNLREAADGENHEHTVMYKEFAATAREEGFDQIADLMDQVGAIESHHEDRYRKLINNIESSTVFHSDAQSAWTCRNCGHIHVATDAPDVCPVCAHPQSFFEIHASNY